MALDYEAAIVSSASTLSAENGAYATAVATAKRPEMIRGYEDIKLRSVRAYLAKFAECGEHALAARARALG